MKPIISVNHTTHPGERPPFINCHSHTFTGDHVPPYVGKKLLPFGLGYILTIPLIVDFFRWWLTGKQSRWKYKKPYKKLLKIRFKIRLFLQSIPVIVHPVLTLVIIDTLLILFYSFLDEIYAGKRWFEYITRLREWLEDWYLLPDKNHLFLRLTIVFLLFFCSKTGRNLVLFVARNLFKFLRILPGPKTKAYIQRYLSIGRFAFYREQADIFGRLVQQYPQGTKFVVLPMDMDYMDAGSARKCYPDQLEELLALKKKNPEHCLPFVFAEPEESGNSRSIVRQSKGL